MIATALVGGLALLGVAGGLFVYNYIQNEKEAEERRMRPIRSQKLLQEMRDYQATHSGDDQIEAVRLFINTKSGELEPNEQQLARLLLEALKLQEKQAGVRKKIDKLLADVRAGQNDPERVDEVAAKAGELENLLQQIDTERVEDVKREIFNARGRSAMARAKAGIAKADKMREQGEQDYASIVALYEKVDEQLAAVLVANKFNETKDLRDDIAMKMSDVAEKWAESGRGFGSVPSKDLLNPREFQPKQADEKSPWDASPGAKLILENGTLVVEGVKPDQQQKPGERAGIAFWSPSPTTAIRHYELKMRVKIIKKGFQLIARQGTGYLRHIYEMQTTDPGAKVAEESFIPVEGAVYDIVERVYGRKLHIEVTPADAGEPTPAAVDSTTAAREGGVGIQVRVGARIEIQKMEIRILK
ncbi:MAG: hypothetical protein HY286_18020 [Planctomycetes bacterium]|nr:hypothetical protein [Planctomycetota bacterium]